MKKDVHQAVQQKYIGQDYVLRKAKPDDLPEIQKLLADNALPTTGVEQYIEQFWVADHGFIIGIIGAHYSGDTALLRSFVVKWQERKYGVGSMLVKQALEQMRSQGIIAVYLLTETAPEYFKRIGFYEISRDQIPAPLLADSGLDQVCPCSSHCLKFLL